MRNRCEPGLPGFGGDHASRTAEIARSDELPYALHDLRLDPPRRVLVLVGGASGLDSDSAARLSGLFANTLVPLLERLDVAVIDGGTDAGVMALMGQARTKAGARFPLLGVAARGTVAPPADPPASDPDVVRLEPNHSHFLLVPGDRWGDESPWISNAACALSTGTRSLTLVAGGGEVTRLDVAHSLRVRRRTLLLAGSGGTADRLAADLRTGHPGIFDNRHERAGPLETLDLAGAETQLPGLLEAFFRNTDGVRQREQCLGEKTSS